MKSIQFRKILTIKSEAILKKTMSKNVIVEKSFYRKQFRHFQLLRHRRRRYRHRFQLLHQFRSFLQ